MNNNYKEAFLDFISSPKFVFGFVVFVSLGAFVLNCAANWLESQPTPKEQRFEVVDTYKSCEVVRYTPDGSARYAYFLDCGK